MKEHQWLCVLSGRYYIDLDFKETTYYNTFNMWSRICLDNIIQFSLKICWKNLIYHKKNKHRSIYTNDLKTGPDRLVWLVQLSTGGQISLVHQKNCLAIKLPMNQMNRLNRWTKHFFFFLKPKRLFFFFKPKKRFDALRELDHSMRSLSNLFVIKPNKFLVLQVNDSCMPFIPHNPYTHKHTHT